MQILLFHSFPQPHLFLCVYVCVQNYVRELRWREKVCVRVFTLV